MLDYQSRDAQILVCGDFNARTAEEPDFVRTAELQPFLPMAPDDEELPDYILHRRNCDKVTPGSQTWGPELLGLCQVEQNNLLILNGGTCGSEDSALHFWQQILRYHYRVVASDDSRLVKLAMVDGCTLSVSESLLQQQQRKIGSIM